MNPTDLLDWPADPIGYAHTSLWPVRLVKEGFKVPGLRVSYANGLVVQGEHTWLATPLFNLHKRLGICTVHVYSASAQVPACMSCYQKRPGFRLPRLTNCWDCPPASVVSAYRAIKPVLQRITITNTEAYTSGEVEAALMGFPLEHLKITSGAACPF